MSGEKTTAQRFQEHLAGQNTDDVASRAAHEVALRLANAAAQAHEIEAVELGSDIPPERQFVSIGHVCQLLQLNHFAVRAAMKAAGIEFAQSVNDVGYLDGKGLLFLSRYVRELRRRLAENEK